MHDAVRLNADQFHSIYKKSYNIWAQIYFHVVANTKLPAHVLRVQDVFRQHPSLPRNLSLKHDKRGALATGASIWGSVETACCSKLPSFRQPVQIRVAVKEPISLSIAEMGETKPAYTACFAQDKDYLAILVPAWTYILSARWTEIMPGSCTLAYTRHQAAYHDGAARCKDRQSLINIDIGNASSEEARWWAAVLAPGQGWQAHMKLEQNAFLSPWSIHLQSSTGFVLIHALDDVPASRPAASFLDAITYLNNFCTRHNLVDQSHAALASVLLLPSMSSFHTFRLPAPRISDLSNATDVPTGYPDGTLQHDWIHKDHHIDKLLTLSCNTRGIRPMLLSAFYEPSVECNAVTPWLQGTLASIKHLAGHNSYLTTRMCMERAPSVAFLWLGSLILGVQEKLLQDWKPFGTTPLGDLDIEVRAHKGCEDHQLQYKGIIWDCKDDKPEFQPAQEADTQNLSDSSLTRDSDPGDEGPVPICFEDLDREREAISENATRNIFNWLRCDGYARYEKEIWAHEWFDMSESDQGDTGEDETTPGASSMLSSQIESWLSDVEPSTIDFAAAGNLAD
ncbi:hypothetical protein F66182_2740 [Fusarium sp. NRRL 66182]|nr:hypothetical protein F66182_2740 [Fusarium sp. NRRL 66182]